ncbi:MAG: RNA polymerase sigma factor [Candidatus Riflebacteria bacterium]|nr:RNA polymerase sigma factor [Candidatus Riflebacteria bacterium]
MNPPEIMDLYRRNPREGFRRLYEEFAPRLQAYLVRAFGLDGQAAEDHIQDAFLPWVETPAAMAAVANPSAYLFASVRNGVLRQRRRPATVPCDEDRLAATPGAATGAGPDPDLAIDIQAALATLPDEQREAVVMRIWGGLSLAEAADQQGVPLQTLASRYRYGLARLKEIIPWQT